jgi:hypothetical protein
MATADRDTVGRAPLTENKEHQKQILHLDREHTAMNLLALWLVSGKQLLALSGLGPARVNEELHENSARIEDRDTGARSCTDSSASTISGGDENHKRAGNRHKAQELVTK